MSVLDYRTTAQGDPWAWGSLDSPPSTSTSTSTSTSPTESSEVIAAILLELSQQRLKLEEQALKLDTQEREIAQSNRLLLALEKRCENQEGAMVTLADLVRLYLSRPNAELSQKIARTVEACATRKPILSARNLILPRLPKFTN